MAATETRLSEKASELVATYGENGTLALMALGEKVLEFDAGRGLKWVIVPESESEKAEIKLRRGGMGRVAVVAQQIRGGPLLVAKGMMPEV